MYDEEASGRQGTPPAPNTSFALYIKYNNFIRSLIMLQVLAREYSEFANLEILNYSLYYIHSIYSTYY
jgi:hypothetical protein